MSQNLKFVQSKEFIRSYSNNDDNKKFNGQEYHRSLRQSRIYARQHPAVNSLLPGNGDYLADGIPANTFDTTASLDNNDHYQAEEKIVCTRYRQSTQVDSALPKIVYHTHCFIKSPYFPEKKAYSVNRNYDRPELDTIQEQWSSL